MNAMEQTYSDVEKLIKKIVWDFKKRHGGDFQELLGEANLAFVLSYKNWKRGSSCKFTSYLCRSIKNNLLRKYQEQRKSVKTNPILNIEKATIDYADGLFDFLDCFAGDALYIAEIITNPDKLSAVYKEHKEISPYKLKDRYCILRHLNKDLNWSRARINNAFGQIKKIIVMK